MGLCGQSIRQESDGGQELSIRKLIISLEVGWQGDLHGGRRGAALHVQAAGSELQFLTRVRCKATGQRTDSSLDERYRQLLDDSEFWPRILRDDSFWRELEKLPTAERDAALDRRVRLSIPQGESKDVRLLRATQLGLILHLVQTEGIARARELLLRETKH